MHKIKVTIKHSELATTFQSNLLSKILDFLSTTTEYWRCISQSHINPRDFVNQKNSVEVVYLVPAKGLLVFKQVYKNLMKSCELPLAEVTFKYLGEVDK